ncbi:MAG: dephospho-CoA kinase [Bacteroidales bacterium]|nr:dephospho-CoA kinase [Bacteroidales bacterium]
MKYVALTGGIGSGKSVVSKIFSCLGVPVYDSDSHAKQLMKYDENIVSALKKIIGEELYFNGKFQKDVMRNAIFSDNILLEKVNSVVHPAVWEDYKQWSDRLSVPFTIMETALLYESGLYKNFNLSICVTADEKLRVQRVLQRDGGDVEFIKKKMENQPFVQKALHEADFIIENNNTFVINQVMTVCKKILQS